MRAFVLSISLIVAVLFPIVSNAQVYPFRTAAPEVTASAAEWQINSEPILVNGSVYLPTRSVRPFDTQVMVRVGAYRGVPVYADVTIEPNSIIYAPIGRDRMRTYERRRDRELAGTTGSRTPSFPVEISGPTPAEEPSVGATGSVVSNVVEERITGTGGSVVPNAVGSSTRLPPRTRRTVVETIPRPTATRGVWVEFGGARWYSDGASTSYSPERFTKVGEHRGFPVYVETAGRKDEIWVQVVTEGPLAPYLLR
jgi:hypothetical protein